MGLRMYLRDRGAVFWGIVFPLILMTLIGLAFGRNDSPSFTIAVVDQSGGLLGRGLLEGLRQGPGVPGGGGRGTWGGPAGPRGGGASPGSVGPGRATRGPNRRGLWSRTGI